MDYNDEIEQAFRQGYELGKKVSEEKPHGKWLKDTDGIYFCNICDKMAKTADSGDIILSNFCPHCGADMRGG